MRKVFVVLMVLGALALLSPPASAVLSDVNQLGIGTWQATYSNYSDLYLPGNTPMTPQQFGGASIPLGAENRAIFYTKNIQPISGPPAVWTPTTQQLTGVFYNLSLALEIPTFDVGGNLTALDLYYVQSSRNPIPGTPSGFGGVIEVYASNTLNFSSDPAHPSPARNLTIPVGGVLASTVNSGLPANWGPSQWVEGTAGARDSIVGSTGTASELWLSGVFVDWATLAPYSPLIAAHLAALQLIDPSIDPVFSEHLDLSTGTGSATGDIFLMGGSFLPMMGRGNEGLGPQVDMTLVSDLSTPIVLNAGEANATLFPSTGGYGGGGYWPVDSQDPVTFDVVIPEPATMTLLGLGLMGIGGLRRRARKS